MWADGAGWKMSHPWMASFVDFDLGRPGWLLGLVPGRSAAAESWLASRDQQRRGAGQADPLDPSAPSAAAIRRLLPQATIVVDHWPLVRLAT